MKKLTLFLAMFFVVSFVFSQTYFGVQNLISTSDDIAASVFSADIDGDGDYDIFACGYNDHKLGWYENLGNDNFSSEKVITTSYNTPIYIYGADIDSDGDIDILASSNEGGEVAWFENDGNGNFGSKIHLTSMSRPRGLYACDLDKDGDMDILTSAYASDLIAWFENDGSQNFTEHDVNTTADGASAVFSIDLDNDGDIDILSASMNNNHIDWYENDGSQNFTRHTISDTTNSAVSVYACDLDGDAYIDIIATSYSDNDVIWFENDGSQNFTQHTIASQMLNPKLVYAFDGDNDGDKDILVAAEVSNSVFWFPNDGNGNFTEQKTITDQTAGVSGLHYADLDNDGDLDVISGSWNDDKVAWYENFTLEIKTQPQNLNEVCGSDFYFFSVNLKDADSLQWHESSDGGSSFVAIEDNQFFSGAANDTLHVFADTSLNGHLFYCEVINQAGSQNSDTVSLTLENQAPQLSTQDVNVFLDSIGTFTLIPEMIVNSSSDNCSLLDTILSQTTFDCSNIGNNSITVTLIDGSGNITTDNVTVLVSDTTKPVIECIDNRTVTANEDNIYIVNGNEFDLINYSDNCVVESVINDFNNSTTLAGAELTVGVHSITWTAIDEAGNQVQCSYTVNVNASSDIAVLKNRDFIIFPNPSDGKFTISLEAESNYLISITDFSGKTIIQKQANQGLIYFDLKNYSSGVYIIKIQSSKGVLTKKLLLVK